MSSGVLYCGGALEILRKFPTFNSSMPVAQPLPSGKGCWFNGLLYEESTEAEMEVIFTDRLSGGHKNLLVEDSIYKKSNIMKYGSSSPSISVFDATLNHIKQHTNN
jgi:hypothetical protein